MLHRKEYSTLIFSSDTIHAGNNKARFNHIAKHLRKNSGLRDLLQIQNIQFTTGMYKGTLENTFVVEARINCISIQDNWNSFIFGNLLQDCYILQNEYNDIFLIDSNGTQTKARFIERNTKRSDFVTIDNVNIHIAF